MDWKDYVAHTLVKLRQTHPHATLKHAMIAAKEPYRRMKQNLYRVRNDIVAEERELAATLHKTQPSSAKKKRERADRVEAVQYGDVLEDMKYGGFDYLGDDFNITRFRD